MADLAVAQDPKAGADQRRVRSWLIGVGALIFLIGSYCLGHYFGYRSGYQAAYIPEHSHFIFEQKRAAAFQKRITDQRRCIDEHVRSIPSIDESGFAGLGEMFRNVGLVVLATRLCDSASRFGVPSQDQLKRIIPSSGN